jgi:hypothetical protein
MKAIAISAAIGALCLAAVAGGGEPGFVRIFDGQTLNGWHAGAKTGHSRASGHRSGGRWVARDGMILGSQDTVGNGGILITDEQFGDFEVVLEMKNDFGPDSGLFLRTDDAGTCYQAMRVKFMEWTETEKRHPDKGGIGLQVHGGGDFTKQYVRYRNIMVKRLDR